MKKTMKLMFYIALAVAVLLPTSSFAQEKRGLFGRSNEANKETSTGLLGTSGTRGNYEGIGTGTGNQGFGQNAPLGSGVAMLIAAGAGYALLKSKKNKKN